MHFIVWCNQICHLLYEFIIFQLRTVLPDLDSGKKLSKYETLQMAQKYIECLSEILQKSSNQNHKRQIRQWLFAIFYFIFCHFTGLFLSQTFQFWFTCKTVFVHILLIRFCQINEFLWDLFLVPIPFKFARFWTANNDEKRFKERWFEDRKGIRAWKNELMDWDIPGVEGNSCKEAEAKGRPKWLWMVVCGSERRSTDKANASQENWEWNSFERICDF